jgi:uncharacterized Ntn-hydrolase superfamily protein
MTSEEFVEALLKIASDGKEMPRPPLPWSSYEPAGEAARQALNRLLSVRAERQLRELAKVNFVGMLATYTAKEVDDLAGQNSLKTHRSFESKLWADSVIDCLIFSADEVRNCLIEVAERLRIYHVERTASAIGSTAGKKSETERPETNRSGILWRVGNPLEQYQLWNSAVSEVREPHRSTYLLEKYFRLPKTQFLRLTDDSNLFEGCVYEAHRQIMDILEQAERLEAESRETKKSKGI